MRSSLQVQDAGIASRLAFTGATDEGGLKDGIVDLMVIVGMNAPTPYGRLGLAGIELLQKSDNRVGYIVVVNIILQQNIRSVVAKIQAGTILLFGCCGHRR